MAHKGQFVAYERVNFRAKSLHLIEVINKTITEFNEGGFSLTVRQIYYQLAHANIIPLTAESYGSLQNLIANGRMAGLISWTAIEDRGRNLMGNRHWPSPGQAIMDLEDDYSIDKWADQEWRPEVHCEKQALENVIGQICGKLDVDFFSCRGYSSLSEQWFAGRRYARYLSKGQRPIVFYLGDHDPSGQQMTTNHQQRLSMFTGTPIIVQRLALNMSQIEEYSLPPNPVKRSDSRKDAYIEEYGESQWELDALHPQVIQDLISAAIAKIRDEEEWSRALAVETADKRVLRETAEMMGGKAPEGDEESDDDEDD